ncbi:hypothetical protein FHU41_001886 [Psychromicrobium silvestre]|uniref:Uncharacterized protein n=2 Tax=Psychromicrobium silvestre TaxID=1645614 RepID=A0A7Y9LU49_9MICC|nr:hypothetical protein [Psychromicrobium silvestre]
MKYYSPSTDYSALERELSHPSSTASNRYTDDPVEPDYSEYADKFADDDEEDTRRIG